MKYVKCLYVEIGSRLTVNKIYEVFNHLVIGDDSYAEIIDNTGDRSTYLVNKDWFEDATAEIRDNVITKLLQ